MRTRPAPEADPAHCPLCGKPNQCAMEVERMTGVRQPACWCTQATFGEELLAQVPASAKGQACVCADCARATASS